MDFALTEEQQLIVTTTREFVRRELVPHEREVEESGRLREELRGMKTTALARGGDFIVNGTKHFISHADHADFVILFAATGEEDSARGKRKLITAFLVDTGTPGFEIRPGYQNVSHRGYTNSILQFSDCRLPKSAVLGELQRGFELANTWLGATRLQVAANCLGRAERALECAKQWAVDRVQF